MTIYLGPTLVFVGWWWLIRKLVRIGRTHRITSIADMISSRYGKSRGAGRHRHPGRGRRHHPLHRAAAPVADPQLRDPHRRRRQAGRASSPSGRRPASRSSPSSSAPARSTRTSAITGWSPPSPSRRWSSSPRCSRSASSRCSRSPAAPGAAFAEPHRRAACASATASARAGRALLFLSASAAICLPRQFQVTVVENSDESHLATASWLFPLYMLLMSLFVLPLAAVGGALLPAGSNPDLFMLALPLHVGRESLATLHLHRRAQRRDLDGHRLDHRALHHGLEPHRRAGGAAAPRGAGRRAVAATSSACCSPPAGSPWC